jgi:cytochrome c peroxidase
LKPLIVFVCLGVLFPLRFPATSNYTSSKTISGRLVLQITQLEDLLDQLDAQAEDQDIFYAFRRELKTLAWTFPLFFDATTIEQITNSKFWAVKQQETGLVFEETGLLQMAELDQDYSALRREGGQWLAELREQLASVEITFSDVVMAMAMDIYQQYFLYLTGYDLIDTEQLLEEYRLVLQNYVELLLILKRNASDPQKKQIRKIIRILKRTARFTAQYAFEGLDRVGLFKKHLIPLQEHLRLLASSLATPMPRWAEPFNWSSEPFTDDWLRSEVFTTTGNDQRDSLIALGALLFVEPMLSGNNKRACISCHKPSKAFSDGRQTSLGFDFSAKLSRNAPTLVNTVFSQGFGHDLTFRTLDEQILSVINHHQEFRSSMQEVVTKLSTSKGYQTKFQTCFPGSSSIDSAQVLTALSSYMESLVFQNSPFDRYMRGESDWIEPAVLSGYNLFMGKASCGSCHFAPLFSGLKPMTYQVQEYQSGFYHRIENDQLKKNQDAGLANSSVKKGKADADQYEFFFKTPTLRNLAYTIPYLHDGTCISLDSLLVHYHYLVPTKNGTNPAGQVLEERGFIRT